mgnify:CR=1 FL=1
MVDATPIDETITTAGQVRPEEIPALAAAGFRVVVNNRPDGEDGPMQPTSEQIREAAEQAGLAYHFIPVTMPTLGPDQVAQFHAAMAEADGPVFAFCRSGARSTLLWALAAVLHDGQPQQDVLRRSATAGRDLSGAAPLFDRFRAAR